MPLTPREISSQLQHKFGFTEATGHSEDHRYYELNLPDLPTIWTKVSHNNKDVGASVESKMARQLHVPRAFFNQMIRCTRSRADYYTEVQTNPTPPF